MNPAKKILLLAFAYGFIAASSLAQTRLTAGCSGDPYHIYGPIYSSTDSGVTWSQITALTINGFPVMSADGSKWMIFSAAV